MMKMTIHDPSIPARGKTVKHNPGTEQLKPVQSNLLL